MNYENRINYRGRKENDTILLSSNTKEGIKALRDEEINAIHKKWISLFYDFKILQVQTFNNNFDQEKYNELRKRFDEEKSLWLNKEKPIIESRFLSLSAAGNGILGLTLLDVSESWHVDDKKTEDYLTLLQDARYYIRLACDDNKYNHFNAIFEGEKLELVQYGIESYNNYLRMKMVQIDIYINKYLNHAERVNSLKNELENMEEYFIKRDINKLSRGKKFYGEWTNCLIKVASELKDFTLFKETAFKEFKFLTNEKNINSDDTGWIMSLLFSIVAEDVQKLNAIAEYLEESESMFYPFAKAMIGDVKNYLILKKFNESESIEFGEVKLGCSVINPLDNPSMIFESDLNIENQLILFDTELKDTEKEFYKNIFTKMDFDLFKSTYKKEYITKTFKAIMLNLRTQNKQRGNSFNFNVADDRIVLSILLKNKKMANFVINDLNNEEISALDDSNIPLVKNTIIHGEDEFKDELLLKLIEKGIEVNKKDEYGNIPLHYAANVGKLDLIKLLINAGAELNIKNNLGQNPLFFAVASSHFEVAKFLINNGTEINHISSEFSYRDGLNLVTKEIECTILDQLEKNYELAVGDYFHRKALKDFIDFFKKAGGKSINDLAN